MNRPTLWACKADHEEPPSVTPFSFWFAGRWPPLALTHEGKPSTMQIVQEVDPHRQLRSLYRSLLEQENRFHEFKQLLALYPDVMPDSEPSDAAAIREQLNERIRSWTGERFDGLSVMQVLLWRSIVVEERFNIALAPWKEANGY